MDVCFFPLNLHVAFGVWSFTYLFPFLPPPLLESQASSLERSQTFLKVLSEGNSTKKSLQSSTPFSISQHTHTCKHTHTHTHTIFSIQHLRRKTNNCCLHSSRNLGDLVVVHLLMVWGCEIQGHVKCEYLG